MKKFKNFDEASKYVQQVIRNVANESQRIIAEQVYKNSNEFTYRDKGDMYKSGEMHSDFNEGIIIERAPYVRRRYYEGGTPGAGNKNAQPRWFDKAVAKYRSDYIALATKTFTKAKKEV